MPEKIVIYAQVGNNPPSPLGQVVMDDSDGPATLRETAKLLRDVANVMDDITTLHQVNDYLDELFR